MKKESNPRYVLRLTLTLFLITALVAAALAAVNAVTQPRIQSAREAKTQAAIEAVLPGGGEEIRDFPDPTGTVKAVYGSHTGYAIQVEPSGFGGPIIMMVGVSKEGTVLGISIVAQTETAGLGAVCGAGTSAGQQFRDQFAGQSGALAVNKDGGSIDAITGATITSRAVTAGVNTALKTAEGLK